MKHLCVMLSLLAVGSVPALAQSELRCGDSLISLGDSMAQVLEQCGEPAGRGTWRDPVEQGVPYQLADGEVVQQNLTVPVEFWTYNFGEQSLTYTLLFKNGALAEVKTGDYGE